MKVYPLIYGHAKKNLTPVLFTQEVINSLHDFGIHWTDKPKKADMFFVVQQHWKGAELLSKKILNSGLPIILLERQPSTRIDHPKMANDSRISCYVNANGILKKRKKYMEKRVVQNHCYHFNAVYKGLDVVGRKRMSKPKMQSQKDLLTKSGIAKLHVLYNNCLWWRLHSFPKIDIEYSSKRKYDISFVGKLEKDGRYAHRSLAIKQLKKLSKRFSVYASDKLLPKPDYISLLQDSKIALSPWGLGEVCIRDFESVSCGCVLVKPDMNFVDTWPNVFVPNKTYIPCKSDFSNLGSIVESILDTWKNLEGMRRAAKQVVIEAWKPDVIANRFKCLVDFAIKRQ